MRSASAITFLLVAIMSCSSNPVADWGFEDLVGTWELKDIRFNDGRVLTPSEPVYWLTLREDSSIIGRANCNRCFGYLETAPADTIDVVFICERLVCGIATEFSVTVNTATWAECANDKLVLGFGAEGFGYGLLTLTRTPPRSSHLMMFLTAFLSSSVNM